MRSISLPLLLGLGLAACTSDTTPAVYISLAYQVRCLDCEPRGPDDAAHDIHAVSGEDGYTIECSVQKVDDVRRVTFTVEHLDSAKSATDHLFKVSSGNLDADESDLACEVKLVEGANTYVGSCSSDPPAESGGPCQAKFRVEDGVIKGGVYCTAIPNTANLSTTRYVVAPSTRTDLASFEIHGCPGL
jgi:hypothetical protein